MGEAILLETASALGFVSVRFYVPLDIVSKRLALVLGVELM